MVSLTIVQKYNSLTKAQKRALDNQEMSCQDDLDGAVEGYYNFNQLPPAERRKRIAEAKQFLR